MKKNYVMRFAAVLLVLVLLSTCVVSGTLAKYVTSGEAEDTATVAKWGVNVTVTGNDAFGEKYNDVIDASGTKVVSNREDTNVLAPGTNGDLGSVTITGQPEVMVDVVVSLDITLSGWEVNSAFYCPLVFSDGTTTINGIDYSSASALETAIEALVNKTGDDVAANTDLKDTYDAVLTWAWAFETGATPEAKAENNEKDTALGTAASATIKAEWTASVTQVD